VVIAGKERRKLHNICTILFVDEVYRWDKAQEDAPLSLHRHIHTPPYPF